MRHAIAFLAYVLPMLLGLFGLFGLAYGQATITDGSLSVTLNEAGLLTGVPDGGLQTYDGKTAELLPGQGEWFGVSYDVVGGTGGHAEFYGAGLEADWSGARAQVRPVAFHASADEAFAVVRAGELELTTWFHFDPDGPYLLANAALTNVGTRTLRNIYYTREWRAHGDMWSFPDDMLVPLRLEPNVRRRAWMFGDMPPGKTVGAGFSYAMPPGGPAADGGADGVDVPLVEWTGGSWPFGFFLGFTNGVSFGDYDADGWPDIMALQGGDLWRNVNGQDWEFAVNLKDVLPPAQRRYGTSFGDYDNDGLPDIGCEPRDFPGDTCFHLFRNLGGGPNFVDVATDPQIVDLQACDSHAETICWGDVDGDGNLDMFLPVYPFFHFGGPGNFFYYNLGPVAPGGEYAFTEMVDAAGLDNPPGTSRPEGAQFIDTDFDGDFDLFCNGTLYRNVSVPGTALFDNATANAGIQFIDELEEGIVFFDKELDGDFDLVAVYSDGSIGVRVYEAKGDGTYELLPTSTVASFQTGLDLGISSEDWDNDGDMDLTTRQVLRRNQFMETGQATFSVATHNINPTHLTSATPAWADWDRDGDLDCALGNWLSVGHFYENTLYGPDTPEGERRYLRVRVMRDSATVPAGLETEYGAIVEVHVAGEKDALRRRKFVSSSGGYLNQNEYVLHFALPDDPAPGDPALDLVLDVTVDLAGPPGDGFLRLDKHVNPALGGIQLAELADREIVVYRSGKVILDGCELVPAPARSIVQGTTTSGLAMPSPSSAVPPLAAAGADRFVGIELDTLSAAGPVRVNELILDGQLAAASACPGGSANVLLWDVSVPGSPALVPGGLQERSSRSTNDRSYFRTNLVLEPGRTYRLVAAVAETRATPVSAPVGTGAVTVNGGLNFIDASPCTGANVEAASLDLSAVALALRFNEDAGSPFVDLGHGLAGGGGVPTLTGSGSLEPGTPYALDVAGAAASAPAGLALGFSPACIEVFGGTAVPALDVLIGGLTTSASGTLNLASTFPTGVAPGSSFYYQVAVLDPGAPQGVALTNAVAGSAQP